MVARCLSLTERRYPPDARTRALDCPSMALVIPNGYGMAVYRFTLAGDSEEMLTTIGIDMVSYADGEAAIAGLHADFVAAWPAANILLGYTFLGIRFLEGQASGPPVVWEGTQAPVVGTNAGPALPPNCAFLVRKRTGLAGRQHRGRMYLPACLGVGEDSVPSTGVMLEAQRVVLQGRVNTGFATGDKVILHDSLSPGALSPTLITSLHLDHRLATQRRRLRP